MGRLALKFETLTLFYASSHHLAFIFVPNYTTRQPADECGTVAESQRGDGSPSQGGIKKRTSSLKAAPDTSAGFIPSTKRHLSNVKERSIVEDGRGQGGGRAERRHGCNTERRRAGQKNAARRHGGNTGRRRKRQESLENVAVVIPGGGERDVRKTRDASGRHGGHTGRRRGHDVGRRR